MRTSTIIITITCLIVSMAFVFAGRPGKPIFETVSVSSNDRTSGYLNGKLVAGANIVLTENNNGKAETLSITTTGLGAGDVIGPASSTDNAVCRFDGTTGKLIKDSNFIVENNGDLLWAGYRIYNNGELFIKVADTGNTFMGYQSGQNITTGDYNNAHGHLALRSNTTGSGNNAYGCEALYNNISGNNNSAYGYQTLHSNTTGNNSSAHGFQVLFSNTTGIRNSGQGTQALYSNTEGDNNTGIGQQALFGNTTGDNNTGAGYRALYENIDGLNNSAYGANSLKENTEGSSNTTSGYQSLANNTTGDNNTATGQQALLSNVGGDNNTATGYRSLYLNTSGSGNVGLGYQAGYYETGSNKLFIDNVLRSNEADGRVKALVYGEFAAATADQLFRINAHAEIGGGEAGVDYTLTFDGETNDGVVTWMEDEGYFDLSHPIVISDQTLQGTPVAGAIEFDNDRMYITNVASQKAIDRTSDVIIATTTVENTTTETTIYTSTIPANALKVSNFVKQLTMGTITTASAADVVTGRVKIGGVTIATLTSSGTGTHTDQPWNFDVKFTVREVGVAAEIAYHIDLELDGSSTVDNQVDIDTTAQADLTVTVEWNNAKAGNILDINQGITEYKN